MTGRRLAAGGRSDRSRPLAVTFDGASLPALAGDTLAAALLAGGVRMVGHSVVLGRPRGIMTAGPEEPAAVIQVDAPFPEPMLVATMIEAADGLAASSLLGQGRLSADPDPARYDAVHHHCEVAVVGAGPAGLAAALAAGRAGVRVLLLDERPAPGGALLTDAETDWATTVAARLDALPNVVRRTRTTVTGCYDDNYLIAVEQRPADASTRQRVWRIRAASVVLATGAHERPIVFADNDLPGVMLAESVRAYRHRYGVLAGRRVVVFTAHDDAYLVAADLAAAGAAVTIVDARPNGEPAADPMRREPAPHTGAPVIGGVVTAAIAGPDGTLGAVRVRRHGGAVLEMPADVLAVAGGWNPNLQLFAQAGGRLRFDAGLGAFAADGGRRRFTVVGAAAGRRTTAECADDGLLAGAAAAGQDALPAAAGAAAAGADGPLARAAAAGPVGPLGGAAAAGAGGLTTAAPPAVILPPPPAQALTMTPRPALALYLVTDERPGSPTSARELTRHFVDIQRDVTVADLARATGAGLASIEHVKRYTTAGTAHDQGKTSGLLATAIVAGLLGVSPEALGTTTFRPPYTPIAFAALAGRERGELYDPVRTTAAHAWLVAGGAVFENVGQWKRAWYLPRRRPDGGLEDMDAAVARECRAARNGVAVMDASTLGKIEVQGPDAAAFLDRLYTNLISSLPVGAVRYSVLCGVDGMVFDDGTVFRLAEQRFLVTTTTGNAAKVLDWLEEWKQTEWPGLQVWCTSVTEQWATLALVGPHSRALLSALAPELAVGNDAFPFMTWRDATVAGLAARVARISFSGELAYEINVAWCDGAALWAAVSHAGAAFDLTPYGTETMHVLRAEKGYPIVGQDTDGTVTPQDLGMGWVVSRKKPDYVGRRSHARPDHQRSDRHHLVGLLPTDRTLRLPEGSQLVADAQLPAPPVPMLGHVTSSYFSVALGRTFALALLAGGRNRLGERVFVVVDGIPRAVTVSPCVLVDPEGRRRDGAPDAVLRPPRPVAAPSAAFPTAPGFGLPTTPLTDFAERFLALSATVSPRVRIAEAPLTIQINLQFRAGSPSAQAVSAALGVNLPRRTGDITRTDRVAVLALGPEELLVLAAPGPGPALVQELRTALGAEPGSVVDVSAARTTLRISGRHARAVLAHGTGIDLPRLRRNTCAQTLLAQCSVVIGSDGDPGDDDDLLTVLVRSSFAAHVARWLLLTAPEYV